ncbi:hypothetical protein HPB47_023484 [Ixodes persulcatus]|uniref:Uncharacterized protein n=1 Tax=Ixodes persulcatus TaxID=34615 RepID=A0AC60Q7Y2_IXOPE|nr:hypothetical protein HPB47_023484 [Ixodes persulcatus]
MEDVGVGAFDRFDSLGGRKEEEGDYEYALPGRHIRNEGTGEGEEELGREVHHCSGPGPQECQNSLATALEPLVALLEEGPEQETIGRATVAARARPTIAKLGRLFSAFTWERRECSITKITMVAQDGEDEGSAMLFGVG